MSIEARDRVRRSERACRAWNALTLPQSARHRRIFGSGFPRCADTPVWLAGVLLRISVMKVQHAFPASAVVLLLIPFGLFGMLLLTPVALLLVAVLPFIAVAALLVMLAVAPASAPDIDHPHAPVAHTGAYSR